MDLKTELLRLIQNAVEGAAYDKTLKGIVVEVNETRYKVKISGAVHSAPSLTSEIYEFGDEVWVLLPQNQIRDAVIIGRRAV